VSNLIEHARRELEMCGQFDEDPAFATAVLAAVSAFAAYPGHSGGSAMAGIHMLNDLLQFNNLSPLTNNPREWIRHTPEMWDGQNHVWQNVRNGSAFSEDGGITYHLVDEDKRPEPYRSKITHDMEGRPLLFARFMDGQREDVPDRDAEVLIEEPMNGCAETLTNQPVNEASEVRVRRVPNGSGYDEVPVKEEGN
jgi:hypothetical protein